MNRNVLKRRRDVLDLRDVSLGCFDGPGVSGSFSKVAMPLGEVLQLPMINGGIRQSVVSFLELHRWAFVGTRGGAHRPYTSEEASQIQIYDVAEFLHRMTCATMVAEFYAPLDRRWITGAEEFPEEFYAEYDLPYLDDFEHALQIALTCLPLQLVLARPRRPSSGTGKRRVRRCRRVLSIPLSLVPAPPAE